LKEPSFILFLRRKIKGETCSGALKTAMDIPVADRIVSPFVRIDVRITKYGNPLSGTSDPFLPGYSVPEGLNRRQKGNRKRLWQVSYPQL